MKSKEELKKLFENGDKPTQENFWEWQDSFWHKDEKLPTKNIGGYKIKGSMPDLTALHLMNNMVEGDVYNLLDTGDNYVYVLDLNNTGKAGWDKLSGFVDLSTITLQTVLENGYIFSNPNDGTFPIISTLQIHPTNLTHIFYQKPSENTTSGLTVSPDSGSVISFSKSVGTVHRYAKAEANVFGAVLSAKTYGDAPNVTYSFKANHAGLYTEGLIDVAAEKQFNKTIVQNGDGKLAFIDTSPVPFTSDTLSVTECYFNKMGNTAFVRLNVNGSLTSSHDKTLYSLDSSGFGDFVKIVPVIASDNSVRFIKIISYNGSPTIWIHKAIDSDDDFDFVLNDSFMLPYKGTVIPA